MLLLMENNNNPFPLLIMNIKNWSTKTCTIVFFGFIAFMFLSTIRIQANESPEQLRKQAREAKQAAMVVDCETIGTRVLECYKGDSKECRKLSGSNAWFQGEYGASPNLLCPTGDFLE